MSFARIYSPLHRRINNLSNIPADGMEAETRELKELARKTQALLNMKYKEIQGLKQEVAKSEQEASRLCRLVAALSAVT